MTDHDPEPKQWFHRRSPVGGHNHLAAQSHRRPDARTPRTLRRQTLPSTPEKKS